MGHNIPTFFIPVHKNDLDDSEISNEYVQNLLGEKFEVRFDEGIRQVTSRNWWYQEAVLRLAKHLEISGLDFLSEELIVLDKTKLSLAFSSLDQLLSVISNDIPVFGGNQQEGYGGINKLRNADCSLAYEKATPDYDVNPSVDTGFEAVRGFYSFLKSLRVAIDNALDKEQYLIYYRPQP